MKTKANWLLQIQILEIVSQTSFLMNFEFWFHESNLQTAFRILNKNIMPVFWLYQLPKIFQLQLNKNKLLISEIVLSVRRIV